MIWPRGNACAAVRRAHASKPASTSQARRVRMRRSYRRCARGRFSGALRTLVQSRLMKALLLTMLCAALVAGAQTDQKGVEFGNPGGHPLLLALHVPDGPGPFPPAIPVHGGGFDAGSRAT